MKINSHVTFFLLAALLLASRVNGVNMFRNLNIEQKDRFLLKKNRINDWIRRIFKKCQQATKSPTTKSPTVKAPSPTKAPSKAPTKVPSMIPTKVPTMIPTKSPTKAPIIQVPTMIPTKSPTTAPTTASIQVACNFIGIANITACLSTTKYFSSSKTNIPTEIGLLTQLTTLGLYFGNLSGTIPSTIGSLSNLIELSLERNQLSGTIPSGIGNLSKLTSFYLYNNKLTGTLPSTLNRLTNLRRLQLHNNPGLSGSIPSTICTGTIAGHSRTIYINCGGNITCSCCSSGSGIYC